MATASICLASFGQEEVNYTRMQMIIHKVCHKVLVAYLFKKIDDKNPGFSVDKFLSINKTTITGGRDSKLYKTRYFPVDKHNQPVSTNAHEWDIQMLYFVLNKCCALTPVEIKDLTFIKDKRNDLCHLGEPKVPDKTFSTFKQDIEHILVRSLKCFGDKIEKEIREDMATIDGCLTEQLIDAYQYLHREIFVAEQIKCLREEHSDHKHITEKNAESLEQISDRQLQIPSIVQAAIKDAFREHLGPPVDSKQTELVISFQHTDTDLHVASTGKPNTATSNVDPFAITTNEHVVKRHKQLVEEVHQTFGGMAESIETRHENWLRVVWGLLYVKDGLHGYVDTKGKQQYQTFMNNVNAKCNSQTCDKCQINSKCRNGRTKVTRKSPLRPGHFCDEMNKEILNNHVRHNQSWRNTDSTKWHDPNVGYWEVAKCYISTAGYIDKPGPNHVDTSGLLSICINSSFINQHITNMQLFKVVQDVRNNTLHVSNYELDGQTADDCLEKMITLLEDPQELIHDTSAKQAANHIRKIKDKTENTPPIMTEALQKWQRINVDSDKSRKEIEGRTYDRLVKELNGFIADVLFTSCGNATSVWNWFQCCSMEDHVIKMDHQTL